LGATLVAFRSDGGGSGREKFTLRSSGIPVVDGGHAVDRRAYSPWTGGMVAEDGKDGKEGKEGNEGLRGRGDGRPGGRAG
jgi:hypothetical protein